MVVGSMNRIRSSLFLIAFSTVILGSCGFYRTWDTVTISLPEGGLGNLQGSLPLNWTISWLSNDGTVGEVRVEEGVSLSVPIPRERPVIVTASPITPHLDPPFRVKPAGFVLPADKPGPAELPLTWEQGFAAEFLLKLAESGISPESINIRKFLEAIELRLGSSPWNLDMVKLSSEFLNGKLWTYSFKTSGLLDVVIPLQTGFWYSEYPPDLPLFSENGTWSGNLPAGLHHFIRNADGSVVSVSINERGDVTVFP